MSIFDKFKSAFDGKRKSEVVPEKKRKFTAPSPIQSVPKIGNESKEPTKDTSDPKTAWEVLRRRAGARKAIQDLKNQPPRSSGVGLLVALTADDDRTAATGLWLDNNERMRDLQRRQNVGLHHQSLQAADGNTIKLLVANGTRDFKRQPIKAPRNVGRFIASVQQVRIVGGELRGIVLIDDRIAGLFEYVVVFNDSNGHWEIQPF